MAHLCRGRLSTRFPSVFPPSVLPIYPYPRPVVFGLGCVSESLVKSCKHKNSLQNPATEMVTGESGLGLITGIFFKGKSRPTKGCKLQSIEGLQTPKSAGARHITNDIQRMGERNQVWPVGECLHHGMAEEIKNGAKRWPSCASGPGGPQGRLPTPSRPCPVPSP